MPNLEMSPAPGERLLRFVGDRVRFTLTPSDPTESVSAGGAFLRTNLGRAERVRQEIIQAYTHKLPSAGASWRDIAMRPEGRAWVIELPLTEVGFFQAKGYLVNREGHQVWPDGANIGITVHPDHSRTANIVYCAFVRMLGETRVQAETADDALNKQLLRLEKQGYTCIPPSGKFRDLVHLLPHIVETLGCRVLHLLPVNPTPTTFARFGRFGSPYASQNLLAVDPALVEFDRRTTGIDQFCELTYAAHARGAKVFLDIVTNHTGWGSTLFEDHPEWFLRRPDGQFASPGAWGVTWEDLVELDHRNPASWEHLAHVFVTWCRRGVDGFRCDAGYKVPVPAWRYITACVRREFPETLFLLEGLGGAWEATEEILTDGGMQWAYSELFQNYSGSEVAKYLDYALRQSERVGLYVHYSETHDNPRLAARGKDWSLLRNRLCALASRSGGYGFTSGVEWLATERIQVHSSRGLNWDSAENLVPELAALNRLLSDHPCFFDGAILKRLSSTGSGVLALRRDSEESRDHVLVLVNTDPALPQQFALEGEVDRELGEPRCDLLGQEPPQFEVEKGQIIFSLKPGSSFCLAAAPKPQGLAGEEYRQARARAAFAMQALGSVFAVEELGPCPWRPLADRVASDPEALLSAISRLDRNHAQRDLLGALDQARAADRFSNVIRWALKDTRRVTLVPPGHWLLVVDAHPFHATLTGPSSLAKHVRSILTQIGFVACFPPQSSTGEAQLVLERYAPTQARAEGQLRFLGQEPELPLEHRRDPSRLVHGLVLLTNGRGGMARLRADLGRIESKYDCLLAANLHPSVPVDRHVLVKRARVWVMADQFLSPLDKSNLVSIDPGPPAHWRFQANAGDGHTVEVHLHVDMLAGRNATVLRFSRPNQPQAKTELARSCDVRLTIRLDLEDRNFHWETKRNGGADFHFGSHCRKLQDRVGFSFTPAPDRVLRAFADAGEFHDQPEWSENIAHPIEQSRGQPGSGDAYSPGWFDLPLPPDGSVTLTLGADTSDPSQEEIASFLRSRAQATRAQLERAHLPTRDPLAQELDLALGPFVVSRGEGKTVIAGYPWFLDWGRDTLICARGLLSAGLVEEVKQLLVTFGRFEEAGTLPNSIFGEDASNRDTSDAPLWYGIVAEEAAQQVSNSLYEMRVDAHGRTVRDVLRNIAHGYRRGTPNGVRVDPSSGLVWSPTHFTWMDTNFPAGTPREGYPIEIQVLWIRLLKQLVRIDPAEASDWLALADQAERALMEKYWIEDRGYLADCLQARAGQAAAEATVDSALRSNYLFAISLGVFRGRPARRAVDAALQYLVVPGALRSLAPLPVTPPLPIFGAAGQLLNQPDQPYWGRYEGDEDTRRKPAYHNGTAWTWTFPSFCEALALAWDLQPQAVAAAKAYLGSIASLLNEGCLGELPEILDGDAPHQQRGCDAQAWAATEALRVWTWLRSLEARR